GFRTEGRPADRRAQDHAASYGATLQTHRTRVVDRDLLVESDLIIALAGQHLREVAAFDRKLLSRTFTLKDLVRRTTAMPIANDEASAEWFERMAATRTRADLLAEGAMSDVADPADASKRVFARVAAEIDELVDRLAPALLSAATRPPPRQAQEPAVIADSPVMNVTESARQPDGQPPSPVTVEATLAIAVVGDLAGSGLADLLHEYLRESGYVLVDLKAVQAALPADAHPAEAVGFAVAAGDAAAGVCVCATGNASAIAVNLIEGARAAVAHDVTSARLARRAVGANVLCIGSRLVSASTAFDAVSAFLMTSARQPA
ncbi:MAG: protein-tyrosine phosphatase, partial [Acidimicrobiaceae bacterium]|nr:protein-tyrosine phosphatase [Acidimicrobiaceae bacterium]